MNRSGNKIQREITPLSQGDCLLVFDRVKSKFDFPVHFHPEIEVNFIQHAANAERIVGDRKSLINEIELVLVGPNIHHGWNNGQCKSELIHESLLERNMMKPIRVLLSDAFRGILFSEETTRLIAPQLQQLSQKKRVGRFYRINLGSSNPFCF